METVARQYPDLTFTLKYDEMNNFIVGKIVCSCGVMVENLRAEGREEYVKFQEEVLGNDICSERKVNNKEFLDWLDTLGKA